MNVKKKELWKFIILILLSIVLLSVIFYQFFDNNNNQGISVPTNEFIEDNNGEIIDKKYIDPIYSDSTDLKKTESEF